MKRTANIRFLLLFVFMILSTLYGLAQNIVVSFIGQDQNGNYRQLNEVNVTNITQNWNQTLVYPDTTLILNYIDGIAEVSVKEGFVCNRPNPFHGTTEAVLNLANGGQTHIWLVNIQGMVLAECEANLSQGESVIKVSLAEPVLALLCASNETGTHVLKMLNIGGGGVNSVEVVGSTKPDPKSGATRSEGGQFSLGDEMSCSGTMLLNGTMVTSDIVTHELYNDEVITFVFELELPVVATKEVSEIAVNTAVCGGEVISDGGEEVTACGVCWATTPDPTISDNHTSDSIVMGEFVSNLSDLVPGESYYVRAYATNSVGTAYGDTKTFTTSIVPIGAIDGLYSISATDKVYFSQGNLQFRYISSYSFKWRFTEHQWEYQYEGDSLYWTWLFCWGTGTEGEDPYGYQNNNFHYSTFYDWGVNPIINGGNEAYLWRTLTMEEWEFLMFNRTTNSGILFAKATVNDMMGLIVFPDDWNDSYYTLDSINTMSASYASNIITLEDWTNHFEINGVLFLPAAGYRYYSPQNVGLEGSYWSSSPDDIEHAYEISFKEDELDIIRGARSYGRAVRLVTKGVITSLPEVETADLSEIKVETAICGGNVTNDGGATWLNRGLELCEIDDFQTVTVFDCGYGIGEFVCTLSGLQPNKTYYVRAYASNNMGTVYGEVKTFTTLTYHLPEVVTTISSVSLTNAIGGGEVIDDGYAAGTVRGVCWSTAPTPTIEDNITEDGFGMGVFTSELNGLEPNTTYHIRAYAYNEVGISYGETKTFITDSIPEGCIDALFSVSATKKVSFSKGNLQYQASTDTWRFAENQWDFVGGQSSLNGGAPGGTVSGSDNANISSTYSGWIDLFGWGTSGWNSGAECYQPWNYTNIGNSYFYPGSDDCANLTGEYANADWGVYNSISNGGDLPNLWRTLTKQEWNYLVNTRTTNSGIRFAKAIVNGVNGLILLPDDWSAATYSLNSANVGAAAFEVNNIDAETWTNVFEANGSVFLPAAGYRDGWSLFYICAVGSYWSSSHVSNSVFINGLYFDDNATGSECYNSYKGRSVRLVTDGLSTALPEVHTLDASEITTTTAICGGIVTDNGGAEVTACGIWLSTTQHMTASDSLTIAGAGLGSFASDMINLAEGKTYYVRAYATNMYGTAYGEVKEFKTLIPEGGINAKFSVSDSTQVHFSRGNLQYRASTDTWRFAENPWDYVGDATMGNVYENGIKSNNRLISATYDGWIDLFGWGTGDNPTLNTSENNDYANFTDWGINPISNGGDSANMWRTLTYNEWRYVTYQRTTNSGIRYVRANVNNVNGVVIFPDNWDTTIYTVNNINSANSAFADNTISYEDWMDKVGAYGAIFLPATCGYRNNSIIIDVGTASYYWSSVLEWGNGYGFGITENSVVYFSDPRPRGHSVRLVYDAE